jgi:Flp pilus assembly protein TadG
MSTAADDDGLASLEFALFAIVLVGAMFLVSVAWRLTEARGEVQDVASEAARAASLVQDPARAAAVAQSVASAALADRSVSCADLAVNVDVAQLRPGGFVAVTILCVADLEDLVLIGVPGSATLSGTAVEVVDVRRGGE